MYRKELFKLHWAQGNGGRKPGCLPKVCFSWEGVSGGGGDEWSITSPVRLLVKILKK